jgi:hypothetical protein
MASSRATTSRCATCIQNSNNRKTKPGITLCDGCRQSFCVSHFVEHRQTLNNTLDEIASQRDALRSRIGELPTRISKEHLKAIDDWESAMLQTVTDAAKDARQQIHHLIINEMERECSELTSKITSFRDNDDYFETDLRVLQAKTERLNEELNDISGLHRIDLNLPTLDCSNMIHVKPFDIPLLPEITKSNNSIIVKPTVEYQSFIGRFLTTHQPSTTITIQTTGYVCASPTMLVDVTHSNIVRHVYHRGSQSTFSKEHTAAIDVQWSSWLQQFILLETSKILAIDAVEKETKVVVPQTKEQWKYMTHWKHQCLVADNKKRIFLYDMNKNLSKWFLFYCWSPPVTCALNESITAIGLNEHHIVLSIQRDDQHTFALRNRDMTHCSNIPLNRPCTKIQALPQNQWLLRDISTQLYSIIDSEQKEHDEPYLSSLKDIKCVVTCDETSRVLLVLLPHQTASQVRTTQLRIIQERP